MAPSPDMLRGAAQYAAATGHPSHLLYADEQLWISPEDDQGFAGLFTLRARSGSRMLVRVHYSLADVEAFDFERCWRNSLDLRIVR